MERGKGIEWKKKMIKAAIYIVIGIITYSWFNVGGTEIKEALEIWPDCSVTIKAGHENQKEYELNEEQIIMLKNLILKSSFRRVFSKMVFYPSGTEQYDILIDWNNKQDF